MPTNTSQGGGLLAGRTVFHDPPPDGFEPLNATQEQLSDFHLPEEPDRDRAPRFHAFWSAFLTPPAGSRFVYLKGAFQEPGSVKLSARWGQPGGRLRKEGSGNWSGGYVKPSHGASLRSVAGRWRVPTVTLPGNAQPNTSYVSSTWIGFDGQRAYRHSSLPQIGTEQIAGVLPPNATKYYSTWVQWWERDHQQQLQPLNIPVQPGDDVRAILTVVSPTAVQFNFRVNAVMTSFTISAPSSAGAVPVQYRVSGATAEWIMERPSPWPAPSTSYDLPSYTQFEFKGCSATGVDTYGVLHEFDMTPGQLITMKDRPPEPRRSRIVSVATRAASDAVRLTYRGP